MIHLSGKIEKLNEAESLNGLLRLSRNPALVSVLASDRGFVMADEFPKSNFKAIFLPFDSNKVPEVNCPVYRLPKELEYLGDDDIVAVRPDDGRMRVLYRNNSHQNSILLTERCNHYCLMCSQPPKDVDDSYLMTETKELVKLIPQGAREIGFTGGEPTLYGDEFISLMQLCKNYLPNTAVHILSNGRAFKEIEFTRKYAAIDHPDMMIGIPIYSDDPVSHNHIVQAENAFDETIRGILNLKSLDQAVEIRIVLHKLNIGRLKNLCEFIARNLLFVDQVALMGLEIIGFTRANLDTLWVDPFEYKDQLSEAVGILNSYGIKVSVYNSQLCLVNKDVEPFYRRSISDWKNEYAPECEGCIRMSECGGFFTSAINNKYSNSLKPFC
jgi:His-Xaa-Ser system radical SAM maturase HxsC